MKLLYIKLLVVILLLVPGIVQAQSDSIPGTQQKEKISFRDPVDSALDMSSFLLEHHGLLPVPSIITEPAIGYGGALALLYFHNRKKQYKTYVPPDITGVAGLATVNGTWGAGAFHMHTFGENRVRTMTIFMKPDINFDYFGNNNPVLDENPLRVNLSSWMFFQRAQLRLGASNFYLGAAYLYMKSEITFDTLPNQPLYNAIVKRLDVRSQISSIIPMVLYDTRNNVFTPTKGFYGELSANVSSELLGASGDYAVGKTKFYGFVPVLTNLYSGYRFEGQYMMGDAPFYVYPFVNLRGIPAMRYQGNNTMLAETEWRYKFYKRWSVLGFVGGGKAFESASNFGPAEWVYNFGTGFRYEVARLLGINMGADFAWGNGEDFAFYIVFGSSWF